MTSPGASSVPASIDPIMTTSAPAAIAFTMSPEYRTPPSAITGTPCPAARAASYTAVICGTPTPATTRVVQIDPGPTPTFTASAPALTSAARLARRDVARDELDVVLGLRSARTASSTPCEWPCAVSTTITSTPALTSAAARSRVRADADRRAEAQPAVRVLRGVRVLDPLLDVLDGDEALAGGPSASTTGSFSIRWRWRIPSPPRSSCRPAR